MKLRVIGFVAFLFAENASAFLATGNDHIADAHAFMRWTKGEQPTDQFGMAYFMGAVAGTANQLSFTVCYPEQAHPAQVIEIAARYIIDNPSQRAEPLSYLVRDAHVEAFGTLQNPKPACG